MAKVYLEVQVGKYPSQNDIKLAYELPEDITYRAFEPLDHPSVDCDPFTRNAICTSPAKIVEAKTNRQKTAKMMSEMFTKAFLDAFESKDTVMGYKEKL